MDESMLRGIFLEKGVAVVRLLIDKKERMLLPVSLVCATPKGMHTFPSLVPMLEFPFMPASIVLFILLILKSCIAILKKGGPCFI